MLTFERAKAEWQLNQLLELVYGQDGPTLRPTLDLIQLTWDQFGKLFRHRGQAFRVLKDGKLAGGCWVEVCGDVLMIHGLLVKAPYRRQGIGTWVLQMLQRIFGERVQVMELAVHCSKPEAFALYEKFGFELVEAKTETGFYRMQKWLRPIGQPNLAGVAAKPPRLR